MICRRHQAIRGFYQRTPSIRSSIDSFDDSFSYQDVWIELQSIHPMLERLSGGLPTNISEVPSVESDFPGVNYNRTKIRMGFVAVSTECLLHAKQYRQVHTLTA